MYSPIQHLHLLQLADSAVHDSLTEWETFAACRETLCYLNLQFASRRQN